jgi:predicted permease
MGQIAFIVIPVFGLIGLGLAAEITGLLKWQTGDALADFVFTVALPLLIFRTIATADFSGSTPWMLWLAYYLAFAVAWFLGTFVVRRLFGRDARAGVVAGVASAYSNNLLIGIPLIITASGAHGAAAVALLIAIHLPILMTTSSILIERALVADGLTPDADARTIARTIIRALLVNPIVLGLFAGLAWRLTGWPLEGPLGAIVIRISDVAATLALFAVGMNLRRYGVTGHAGAALACSFIKLVLMPAMVFLLVATVIHLPSAWARGIVIAAGCPTGVNAYLVASRFKTGEGLASSAITITTALAVVTIAFWLHMAEYL